MGNSIMPTDISSPTFERDYWRARYQLVAKALCRAKGLNPDELIDDAGHECWELVGHDAAQEEIRRQD